MDRPLRINVVGSDPAAISLDGRQVGPRDPLQHAALGRFLDLCFVGWPSHHHWTTGVLDDLAEMGLRHDLSVVTTAPDLGIIAASLMGLRDAWWGNKPVKVAMMYVAGAHPALRRKGLFHQVNEAVTQRARAAGAEAICLQTLEQHASAKVWQRLGYHPVERYHVVGAALPLPGGPTPLAHMDGTPLPILRAPSTLTFARCPGIAPSLHRSVWEDDQGGVETILWKVRARNGPRWRVIMSCEVVAVWGEPTDAARAALSAAAEAGATGAYQAPGTGPTLPGLVADAHPEYALRLMLPLTDLGAAMVNDVTAWHPTTPAP